MIQFLRDLRARRSFRISLALGMVFALVGTSLAFAEEGDPPAAPVEEQTTPEPIVYRPDDNTIVFSLPDESGEFVDCTGAVIDGAEEPVVDGGEAVLEGEGEELAVEGEELALEGEEPSLEGEEGVIETAPLPTDTEGCYGASTLGPNGQTNHGQVVRAYVHALKSLEFDGPRGHLVRMIAKSPFGKEGGDLLTLEGEDLGLTATSQGSNGHGHGRGHNKPKKND